MKISTTELLQEVSNKLENYSSWYKREEATVASSYYDLKSKTSSLAEPANAASKLFASIDYILARVLACKKRKKETDSDDWPCELNIDNSSALVFKYMTEVFVAIIFEEKSAIAESTGYYLLILQTLQ